MKCQFMLENDLEICYSICFSELVYYPDENDDLFLERPEFKKIRDFLEIDIDVIEWINQCYEILGGDKNLQSINLYYSKDKESYILLENYFDPIDQLDIIQVGIKTTNNNKKLLKKLARAFSDECRYIISYEEGNSSISKYYPIDEKDLRRRLEDPKVDLSKGKLVRKIYTGNSKLNEEFSAYYWRDNTK
jgi:hypothetical protein